LEQLTVSFERSLGFLAITSWEW